MTYKGYVIDCCGTARVVYHPDYGNAVFADSTLKECKRFIDAYRNGTVWAVKAFTIAVRTGAPAIAHARGN